MLRIDHKNIRFKRVLMFYHGSFSLVISMPKFQISRKIVSEKFWKIAAFNQSQSEWNVCSCFTMMRVHLWCTWCLPRPTHNINQASERSKNSSKSSTVENVSHLINKWSFKNKTHFGWTFNRQRKKIVFMLMFVEFIFIHSFMTFSIINSIEYF